MVVAFKPLKLSCHYTLHITRYIFHILCINP